MSFVRLKVEKMRAYLDNGASTKVDRRVFEAMKPLFLSRFGNASSIHSWGQEAKAALENARAAIAKKINALPEEIIFTSGGSEADNLAIKGIARANRSMGNHIITSAIEHPAVLEACEALKREGFEVTKVGVDSGGFVNPDDVERAITSKTVLVSIMHANNEIGTIEDIEAIGKVCRGKGVIFHTDAVQSFTKVQVDVKKQNLDLATMSAHKIHGPKGIGALYVRKGIPMEKLIHGGRQERNLRAGTENVTGAVGFARAAELAKQADVKKMEKLRDVLINGLLAIQHTRLNGPRRNRLCNNANISFRFIEGEGLLLRLNDRGIAASTGSACSSQTLEPSHVLLAIGLDHETAHGSLRFTISRDTSKKEIEYAVKCTEEEAKKLRAISPLYKGSR